MSITHHSDCTRQLYYPEFNLEDIMSDPCRLASRNPVNPHMIMDIKRSKSNTMADDAARALEQIVDGDYTPGLKGEVIMYGMAFKRKDAKVCPKGKCCNAPA